MRVITPHSGEFLIRDEGLDTVKEFTKLLRDGTDAQRPSAPEGLSCVQKKGCARFEQSIRSSLFPGKARRKPHEEELARLKREPVRVTQEREFLKSVAAYFAKPSS